MQLYGMHFYYNFSFIYKLSWMCLLSFELNGMAFMCRNGFQNEKHQHANCTMNIQVQETKIKKNVYDKLIIVCVEK